MIDSNMKINQNYKNWIFFIVFIKCVYMYVDEKIHVMSYFSIRVNLLRFNLNM